MNRVQMRRARVAVAAGAAAILLLAACSDSGDDDNSNAAELPEIDCAPYEAFGDISGTTVHLYSSIVEPEQANYEASYARFKECTGVNIDYEASREFEAQLLVRLQAGNAPDIAFLPQPGLLHTIVNDFPGAVVPAPPETVANVEKYFSAAWKGYGTVDGTFYTAPMDANAKSFVWYSPKMFEDAGYEIPKTWTELMDLSQKIADASKADPSSVPLPWCAGVESGDATGWPGTDWVEDVVLRTAGPDVYTQWYTHEIPFNDPQIVEAFDTVGKILKNPEMVNAGLGGVDSIATTPWTSAGFGILDGACWMHRAANFYQTQWPAGTDVSPDGDVFAFYLPTDQTDIKPMLGGGTFVAAFNDRPEVKAFQTFLSSPEWANAKAITTPGGGWISANNGLDLDKLATDFDGYAAGLLADPDSVVAFDASDLMPAEVGAGTFWTGIVNWLTGQSTQQVVDAIEASWPSS